MKILVTGHRGFIGSRLVPVLERAGHEVCGYDILDGDDIRDTYNLDKIYNEEQFDLTIHLAARAGVMKSMEYPDEYISTNLNGTQNIINACRKNNCGKLIYFSSSSVLGGNPDKEKGLSEIAGYNPISVYGVSKMASEYLVKQSGLNWSIVRPFSVYGEKGRKDMVFYKWIEQINNGRPVTCYGNGKSARGYTYVGDLVEGVKSLAKYMDNFNNQTKDIVRIFHLGGSEVISLEDLHNIMLEVCDKKKIDFSVEIPDRAKEDIAFSSASTLKAGQILNFHPKKRFKKIVTKIFKDEICKKK